VDRNVREDDRAIHFTVHPLTVNRPFAPRPALRGQLRYRTAALRTIRCRSRADV